MGHGAWCIKVRVSGPALAQSGAMRLAPCNMSHTVIRMAHDINIYPEAIMEHGYIKMYDPLKQFGFIVSEDDDELYFSERDIHPKFRNLPIREGLRVGFDLKREQKGDRAVNVRLLP